MAKVYDSILDLVGKTPLVELKRIEEKEGLQAKLIAKVESFNPAGSVKDRIAKAMIEDAEAKGLLKEGSVIIEPTSGNTLRQYRRGCRLYCYNFYFRFFLF